MFVVSEPEQLNFWLRRFAPRIVLRLSPEFVEVSAAQGLVQARTTIAVVREGAKAKTLVVGIGDEPVTDASAVRVQVFGPHPGSPDSADDILELFLRAVLRRLPASGSFIRPIVIVEGLASVNRRLDGREREVIVRVLAKWGAVAAVVP